MFVIVWYILLLIVTVIGLNIVLDYSRYGKRIFDCFKKRDNKVNMTDLLINILKNELKDKEIIFKRNDDYFIAITKFDIFLIQLINEGVHIKGSISDYKFKTNNTHVKEIENRLPQFINDIKLLLKNNFIIKPIIVKTNKDCSLSLNDFDKRNIFTLQDFSYMLYKLQHSTSKYSESEIETLFEEIKGLLNGNN